MIKRCCIRLLFTCYIKKFNSVILSFCISAEFYFSFGTKVPEGVFMIFVKLMKYETLSAFFQKKLFY